MKNLFYFLLLLLIAACSKDEGVFDLPITPRDGPSLYFQRSEYCVGEDISMVFDNGQGSDCGQSKIQQLINGEWVTIFTGVPVSGFVATSFIPDHTGDYFFRASWHKSGPKCEGKNVKWIESWLTVSECCRDYFHITPICEQGGPCQYGVELRFMATMLTWFDIVGKMPAGVELCGLYADDGTIVENLSGDFVLISLDVEACAEVVLLVYCTADRPESFGQWTVSDMSGVKYLISVQPCEL